jgi:hypothetical protein
MATLVEVAQACMQCSKRCTHTARITHKMQRGVSCCTEALQHVCCVSLGSDDIHHGRHNHGGILALAANLCDCGSPARTH